MRPRRSAPEPVRSWLEVPTRIERALAELGRSDLDLRGGPEGWSIREIAHHLVEANLVATTIVLAAIGNRNPVYDWSWLNPDAEWMRRAGYHAADPAPAVEALRAVGRLLASLLAANAGALRRRVRLRDAPGARLRAVTVSAVLREETKHAKHHLEELRGIRRNARP